MGMSHYPRVSTNLMFAFRWPRPPARPGFLGLPSFDLYNRADKPLGPGDSWQMLHDTAGMSRIFGSVVTDVPVLLSMLFDDSEVDPEGGSIRDDTLAGLTFPLVGRVQLIAKTAYNPEQLEELKAVRRGSGTVAPPPEELCTGKVFEIPPARWMRVAIRNVSDRELKYASIHFRASVF